VAADPPARRPGPLAHGRRRRRAAGVHHRRELARCLRAAAWGGRTLGVKAHEFRRFAALPEAVHVPFEVALDIDPGDAA
jgi:hypothetical protein